MYILILKRHWYRYIQYISLASNISNGKSFPCLNHTYTNAPSLPYPAYPHQPPQPISFSSFVSLNVFHILYAILHFGIIFMCVFVHEKSFLKQIVNEFLIFAEHGGCGISGKRQQQPNIHKLKEKLNS